MTFASVAAAGECVEVEVGGQLVVADGRRNLQEHTLQGTELAGRAPMGRRVRTEYIVCNKLLEVVRTVVG